MFGIGKATAWKHYNLFCNLVHTHLAPICIKWPSSNEQWDAVKNGFSKKKANFKNCVGAIDGCHIPIHGVSDDRLNTYINRKGWASINILAICDSNKMFMYVNVRWPGSVSDKRILSTSNLGIVVAFDYLIESQQV